MGYTPEILSPAGSYDAVLAAVQNGADAVYLGFGNFNARRNAKNFTDEQIQQAISYCTARGVKVYITMNTIIYDREIQSYINDIHKITEMGATGVIVQDFGMARLVSKISPQLELHGSTQMTVHSLDGALKAKNMGFKRVVLSRELSFDDILYITQNCGIETEVFIHGALCMCYSGQCYLSGILGGRSGNRGLCAQPCRLPFAFDDGKPSYPLSLKDLSLANYIKKLTDANVACFKIEGRMKRAEYVAIVTKIFSRLVRQGAQPTRTELEDLRDVFSRDGFTDGYFTGKKGQNMFGIKTEVPFDDIKDRYKNASQTYENGKENSILPVKAVFKAGTEIETTLEISDLDGNTVVVTEQNAQIALKRPSTDEDIKKALTKTGGTPFYIENFEISMEDNIIIPMSILNKMRRDALDILLEERKTIKKRKLVDYTDETLGKEYDFDGYTISVQKMWQVTEFIMENPPKTLYIPLFEALDNIEKFKNILSKQIETVITLPRIFTTTETQKVEDALNEVKSLGIDTVLVSNIGHFEMAQRIGLEVYADFGLNITNSSALCTMEKFGAKRVTLSFEMKYAQIRDLIKPIPCEMIAYGHLPLMIFENCAIKRKTGKCTCTKATTYLTDRKGEKFALLPEYGCRNTLINSKPLYLADKKEDFTSISVKYARLMFTTEKSYEIDKIYKEYLSNEDVKSETSFTRGLYTRGVI